MFMAMHIRLICAIKFYLLTYLLSSYGGAAHVRVQPDTPVVLVGVTSSAPAA